jgi:DNA polymerase zeta
MKYESRDQKRAEFEAKGIETIRRDQCSLTQKVLKESLVTLYKSGIEAVKSYLTRQWLFILGGHCPVSDFILTGRVRSRYRGGRIGPVQAVLAKRLAEADPGRVVRHKERQPYVIVASPGLKFTLKDNVLTPIELLEQWDTYTIHTTYYVTRHLNAALQRCLSLDPYQMDVHAWFEQCPKPRGRIHFWPVTKLKASSTLMISTFFGSDRCSLCGQKAMADGRSRASVCQECRYDPVQAGETAIHLLSQTQQEAMALAIHCSKCNLCFEDSSTFATVMQNDVKPSGKVSDVFEKSACSTRRLVSSSIAIPIANCTCIDCPTLFDRHSLREKELEAVAVCRALNLV